MNTQAISPKGKNSTPAPKPRQDEIRDPSDFKLIEVFSVDKNPGKGKLTYAKGNTLERIDLGKSDGHYAIGFVFRSSQMPEPYRSDFKNNDVLQIALGTLKSHLQTQVPQFATATLITDEPLKKRTTFRLMLPSGKEKNLKNTALFLFTSPKTPNEQTDEDKLKSTFFAPTGTVVVTPQGKFAMVRIRSQGRKYNFAVQVMRMEFSATLSTPFNPQENTLRGSIEVPIYAPYGKGAKLLTEKIAQDVLGNRVGPLPSSEGLNTHNRDVAGSTKKDTERPGEAPED